MTVKTTSAKNKKLHLTAVDGFRGVLALAVAAFHTSWPSKIIEQPFFQQGTVMVDLFFVFSGFLMYKLYLNRLGTKAQAKDFLKRRFARLYPLHLFMLVLMIGFALARLLAHKVGIAHVTPGEILPFEPGAPESIKNVLANLFMLQAAGVTDSLTFNYPSWTISGDLFAYTLFALIMVVSPPRKFVQFLPLLASSALMYFFLSTQKQSMDITYDYGAIRVVAGFIVGMFGAFVFNKVEDTPKLESKIRSIPAATVLEILAIIAFVGFVIYMPGKGQFWVAPFSLFFVVVFAFNAGIISVWMSNRLFLYLAKISYSVYMVHILFAILMGTLADIFITQNLTDALNMNGWLGDVYFIPYLAIVIGFSHFTWKYVEGPGNKLVMGMNFTALYHKMIERMAPPAGMTSSFIANEMYKPN